MSASLCHLHCVGQWCSAEQEDLIPALKQLTAYREHLLVTSQVLMGIIIVILDNAIQCTHCSKHLHVLAHLIHLSALRLVAVMVLIISYYYCPCTWGQVEVDGWPGSTAWECMTLAQSHTTSKWQLEGSS